jgi:hypothetical protein
MEESVRSGVQLLSIPHSVGTLRGTVSRENAVVEARGVQVSESGVEVGSVALA